MSLLLSSPATLADTRLFEKPRRAVPATVRIRFDPPKVQQQGAKIMDNLNFQRHYDRPSQALSTEQCENKRIKIQQISPAVKPQGAGSGNNLSSLGQRKPVAVSSPLQPANQ